MKIKALSVRCAKEILRDPLNLFFGIGFPTVLILLLSAIQANIPESLFEIERLTPGVTVFGLCFISLFCALTVSRDRESALLQRLYTAPVGAFHFIMGYFIPMIPLSLMQTLFCYLVGAILGLDVTAGIVSATVFNIPASVMFISIGILFGSILTSKQAGAICGAVLTNFSAWLSGIWFDVGLVGGAFEKIANALPFVHAVELSRAAYMGNISNALSHLIIVTSYALILSAAATFLFFRQMRGVEHF